METFYTKEPNFIEEDDERSEVIKSLTDSEEVDAAIELAKEKIFAPETTDNAEGTPEPEEKLPDNSEEPTEPETKADETKADETVKPEDFILTDEIIDKSPAKAMLSNFRGKGKDELAKAAANAIAMKNPYLKDNKEAIDAITNQIKGYDNDKLISTLIETQSETGRKESPKVELPQLPENDERVSAILNQETIKRLQKKYPEMPGDMNSIEYREWRRDLEDENPDNVFKEDLQSIRKGVSGELQKVVYAKYNLDNLYADSPQEILPEMTDENKITELKNLNDNWREINNKDFTEEVEQIKSELQKFGLSEKDLGLDFSLTKDSEGTLYNKYLSSLFYSGDKPDPNVIGIKGKIPFLKKGELLKKFILQNHLPITNQVILRRMQENSQKVENLKKENLNDLGGLKSGGAKPVLTSKVITEETDPLKLEKMLADLKAKIINPGV